MEYFEGITISELLIKVKRLSERKTKIIVRQLLEIIAYMHSKGYSHRDIKAENILIREDTLEIKLIDLAFAVKLKHKKEKVLCNCGTLSYMAPEILQKQRSHPHPTDVWAIGVLMVRMRTGRYPFVSRNLYLFCRWALSNS